MTLRTAYDRLLHRFDELRAEKIQLQEQVAALQSQAEQPSSSRPKVVEITDRKGYLTTYYDPLLVRVNFH